MQARKIELESLDAEGNYWSVTLDGHTMRRFYVRDISITEKCETMQVSTGWVQYGHRQDIAINATCWPDLGGNGGLDSAAEGIMDAIRPLLTQAEQAEAEAWDSGQWNTAIVKEKPKEIV